MSAALVDKIETMATVEATVMVLGSIAAAVVVLVMVAAAGKPVVAKHTTFTSNFLGHRR